MEHNESPSMINRKTKSKLKFWLSVFTEVVLYPFARERKSLIVKERADSNLSNKIIYHIHEWCGYPFEREKKIRYRDYSFKCGLKPAIARVSIYRGSRDIEKVLTLSEATVSYVKKLKKEDFFDRDFQIVRVGNDSMDFSGYAHIVHNVLQDASNDFVFLTNSSVDDHVYDFIDDYISCYLKNKNIGILGVSYSSKIYQSLIKSNFTPHVQSFFMLTTSEIIREIVEVNGGRFPGEDEFYKLGLIKFGEAKLSQIVQQLGYDLGIVNDKGDVTVLPRDARFKSEIVDGDYRLFSRFPNRINTLKVK